MEITYRLEFNEQQQMFHLDSTMATENTHGWFTVYENCTDTEFRIYESFVNRGSQKRLTKEYILKSANELKVFISNLLEYNLSIK